MEKKLKKCIWERIRREAEAHSKIDTLLEAFLNDTILSRKSLEDALSYHLSNKLHSEVLSGKSIKNVIDYAIKNDKSISSSICCDLEAIFNRDAAANEYLTPLLFYKGFHAIQSYRIAHFLWSKGNKMLAFYFQNRISELFQVDIHPACKIGSGIFIDHATSVVIGETATVDDNVSILHEVTLGGTGKVSGDRHPKVGKGVLIGAGAKILGNITIGDNSKIGAGSVVLDSVPPHCTVVGVPAKVVGEPESQSPALDMIQIMPEKKCGKGKRK